MASATLSIMSLYEWANDTEHDLFELLVIPETITKSVLVHNILMQAAPFEVAYADPEIMHDLIGIWSNANIDKWNRWAELWENSTEFNPLENFDRYEHEEIEHSGTDEDEKTQTRNLAGSNNRTQNLSDNETKNLTNERKVSAYDSSDYQNKERETQTGTDNVSHTGTDNVSSTDTGTIGDVGSYTYGHNIERDAHFHGNIGTTSMARLFTEMAEVGENWDLYAKITQDFIGEFCVMVY